MTSQAINCHWQEKHHITYIIGPWTSITRNMKWVTWDVLLNTHIQGTVIYMKFSSQWRNKLHLYLRISKEGVFFSFLREQQSIVGISRPIHHHVCHKVFMVFNYPLWKSKIVSMRINQVMFAEKFFFLAYYPLWKSQNIHVERLPI